jgi:hypothetical protein
MAAMAELPVQELKEQARTHEVHAARGLATAIAWVFVAIGWLPGALVTGVIFLAVTIRYGYWRGRGLSDEQITARAEARRAAAQPQPAPART